MKKRVVILISLAIFLSIISFISSVDFNVNSQYKQGETMIVSLSGSFLDPVKTSNVYFYRNYVQVPMFYDITQVDTDYYIYAILPETQGNYSVAIKNINYMKGSVKTDEEIKRNFTISSETADFNVNPGFIVSRDDFSIKIQNLKDSKIDVTSEGKSISLKSGEIKYIEYLIKDFTSETKKLTISSSGQSYEIPLKIIKNDSAVANQTKFREFKFSPSSITTAMSTNSTQTVIFYVFNTGKETIDNITLSLSESLQPYVNLSKEKIEDLDSDSNIKLELLVKSDIREKNIEGILKGKISSDSDSNYIYLPINLTFIQGFVPSNNTQNYEDDLTRSKNCTQLGGKLCKTGEVCDSTSLTAKDGSCCLGNCKTSSGGGSGGGGSGFTSGKVIGWSLVVLVLIFLYWFFTKKYKGVKRESSI